MQINSESGNSTFIPAISLTKKKKRPYNCVHNGHVVSGEEMMNEDSPSNNKQILSPREHQALDLLIEGLTNRQIAARIGICEKTVEKILAKLYQKANTHCRAGTVAWALRQKDGE